MELITNLATSKGSEHVCEVLYLFFKIAFVALILNLFLRLSSYFLHSCMFNFFISGHVYNKDAIFRPIFSKMRTQCHLCM